MPASSARATRAGATVAAPTRKRDSDEMSPPAAFRLVEERRQVERGAGARGDPVLLDDARRPPRTPPVHHDRRASARQRPQQPEHRRHVAGRERRECSHRRVARRAETRQQRLVGVLHALRHAGRAGRVEHAGHRPRVVWRVVRWIVERRLDGLQIVESGGAVRHPVGRTDDDDVGEAPLAAPSRRDRGEVEIAPRRRDDHHRAAVLGDHVADLGRSRRGDERDHDGSEPPERGEDFDTRRHPPPSAAPPDRRVPHRVAAAAAPWPRPVRRAPAASDRRPHRRPARRRSARRGTSAPRWRSLPRSSCRRTSRSPASAPAAPPGRSPDPALQLLQVPFGAVAGEFAVAVDDGLDQPRVDLVDVRCRHPVDRVVGRRGA